MLDNRTASPPGRRAQDVTRLGESDAGSVRSGLANSCAGVSVDGTGRMLMISSAAAVGISAGAVCTGCSVVSDTVAVISSC